MTAQTPMPEITDMVLEVGGDDLNDCMQCGTCTSVCPWGRVASFSPRLLIRQVGLGLTGFEEEALWRCVTCASCNQRCPREIDIIDVIRSTRAVMLASGAGPATWRAPLTGLAGEGNPWGATREERHAWSGDRPLPAFGPSTDQLFLACCTHAYDARNQKALRVIVRQLARGGVDFGILGDRESCCGDQASKAGDLETHRALTETQDDLLHEQGVQSIIVTSPHCLKAYADRHPSITTIHHVQQLDQLISSGGLVPTLPQPVKVAYHDPCYLGRHGGVYEEPRRVLASIPGLELREFPHNRSQSLCCGGGGGGTWSEVPVEERFSVLRVQQALDLGVEVIATACPFCTLMIEDGLRAVGAEDRLKVLDVAEILAPSLPPRADSQPR